MELQIQVPDELISYVKTIGDLTSRTTSEVASHWVIERLALAGVIVSPARIEHVDNVSRPGRTLHEAMELVLREVSHPEMPAKEIARILNERGLYRMKDGRPVRYQQCAARASKYTNLFTLRPGNLIALRELYA
jgi:hypothetical protein